MGRTKRITTDSVVSKATPLPVVEDNVALDVSSSEILEIKQSCKKNKVGIDNYIIAIKEALQANKVTLDRDGEEHIEPDHDKRLKAALMGLELEGYIRNKASTVDNSKHTHVTYSWQPVQVINNDTTKASSSTRIYDVN